MTTLGQINTAFPEDDGDLRANSNGYGSAESNQSKSPLAKFNLFNGLAPERKLKADGQPPKRRGPKPDSKPALTRRQELNRQAQRTHRERKEQYIKALEQEVMRLKDSFAICAKERDAWEAEVRRLTDILASHRIPIPPSTINLPANQSSSGSFSGSFPPTSATSQTTPPPLSGQYAQGTQAPPNNSSTPPKPLKGGQTVISVDYDQTGIDFVLALEKPCMDHMQMLCVQSQQSEGDDISGHVLMATCPSRNHLIERPDVQYPHMMPELKASDLLKLLDLSNRLPLQGEITPIMAWAAILRHEHVRLLTQSDFEAVTSELLAKVRCYGFGAVLEEFEVEDALQNALSRRGESESAEPS